MEKFCLSCGAMNHHKSTNCSTCNSSFENIQIEIPKTTVRATQIQPEKSFGVKLGDKFDFSIFESIAADLEKEVGGLGDEKDLGKWGAKSIDGKDLVEQIRKNLSK